MVRFGILAAAAILVAAALLTWRGRVSTLLEPSQRLSAELNSAGPSALSGRVDGPIPSVPSVPCERDCDEGAQRRAPELLEQRVWRGRLVTRRDVAVQRADMRLLRTGELEATVAELVQFPSPNADSWMGVARLLDVHDWDATSSDTGEFELLVGADCTPAVCVRLGAEQCVQILRAGDAWPWSERLVVAGEEVQRVRVDDFKGQPVVGALVSVWRADLGREHSVNALSGELLTVSRPVVIARTASDGAAMVPCDAQGRAGLVRVAPPAMRPDLWAEPLHVSGCEDCTVELVDTTLLTGRVDGEAGSELVVVGQSLDGEDAREVVELRSRTSFRMLRRERMPMRVWVVPALLRDVPFQCLPMALREASTVVDATMPFVVLRPPWTVDRLRVVLPTVAPRGEWIQVAVGCEGVDFPLRIERVVFEPGRQWSWEVPSCGLSFWVCVHGASGNVAWGTQLTPGQDAAVLAVAPGASVVGHLTDEGGESRGTLRVRLRLENGVVLEAQVGAGSGRFELVSIPGVRFTIEGRRGSSDPSTCSSSDAVAVGLELIAGRDLVQSRR